jgi:hypothetical protein
LLSLRKNWEPCKMNKIKRKPAAASEKGRNNNVTYGLLSYTSYLAWIRKEICLNISLKCDMIWIAKNIIWNIE